MTPVLAADPVPRTASVVVAVYGPSHVLFARVLLESVRRHGHRPILVHAGLDAGTITEMGPCDSGQLDFEFGGTSRQERVARKVEAWSHGLRGCADGDLVAFLDADTLVRRRLDAAFGLAFDVAITEHEGRPWKVNSGVVFVRVSARTRAWMETWRALTLWITTDPDRRQRAVDGWGGADQASLVASATVLHGGHGGLSVARLQAEVWNADWNVGENAAIWHLKGLLPYLVGDLALQPGDPRLGAVREWQRLRSEVRP